MNEEFPATSVGQYIIELDFSGGCLDCMVKCMLCIMEHFGDTLGQYVSNL